ncbi:hypothetical protein HDV06_000803 [Boothiomyces sp. JEL0866]|nr:hypothetical protein HDV06_000803 [Boothiomyces sp. JEL0866]
MNTGNDYDAIIENKIDFIVEDFLRKSEDEKLEAIKSVTKQIGNSENNNVQLKIGVASFNKISCYQASEAVRNIIQSLNTGKHVWISLYINCIYNNRLEYQEVNVDMFRYVFDGFEPISSRIKVIVSACNQRICQISEVEYGNHSYFPSLKHLIIKRLKYEKLNSGKWIATLAKTEESSDFRDTSYLDFYNYLL